VWLAKNTDDLDNVIETRAEFERLTAKAVADGLSIEEIDVSAIKPTAEMMRSIDWNRRMVTASQWLWEMRKAGQLPDEAAEAFNHLFRKNGWDISQMVGCERLPYGTARHGTDPL
jgi:hypothetical protein